MTVAQKAVLSFVLSALLVGGIAALAYTGVLDLIENHFYNPSASEALIRETTKDAKLLSGYLSDLQNHFLSLLSVQAVRNSFLPLQDAKDVYDRSRLFGELLESFPAIHSVRFIDSAGSQIHFSTHPDDVARSNSSSIIYKGYNEDPANLPFDEVLAQEGGRLILDSVGGRIIFSFPLYDSLAIYRGVALFTVSARALSEAFIAAGKRGVGENMVLVANPAGLVDVIPGISGETILMSVIGIWAGGYRSIVPFVTSTATLALVSVPMDQGLYFGRIVNESVLHFSEPAKYLVVATIFLTLFLIMFFLFNFKQGSPAMARVDAAKEGAAKLPAAKADDDLEELEPVESTPRRGLLSAASSLSGTSAAAKTRKTVKTASYPNVPRADAASSKTINPKELAAAGAGTAPTVEVVSPFDTMFSSLGELEDIPNGGGAADSSIAQPFAVLPGDPQPLPRSEDREVIVERDGIPYINSIAVSDDDGAENIDTNFIKLVKSVTDT